MKRFSGIQIYCQLFLCSASQTVQQSAAMPESDSVVRLKMLLKNVSMKNDLQGRIWEIPKTGLQAKSQLQVEI